MIEPETISEEQLWRATTYSLLATLLQGPPDRQLLQALDGLYDHEPKPEERPLSLAWQALADAARNTPPGQIATEYQQLFIGLNRGEILPYASWYRTGFLMEKPLAELRDDLREFGIQRKTDSFEPEDHIAALFEVMTLLIQRNQGQETSFFVQHIQSWAPRLFREIATSRNARFYAAVANLGGLFLDLEQKLVDLGENP